MQTPEERLALGLCPECSMPVPLVSSGGVPANLRAHPLTADDHVECSFCRWCACATKTFAEHVEETIRSTGARTVLDLGCGGEGDQDAPYAPAVLRALPADGRYICIDMDEAAIEGHRKLTRDDPRMEYRIELFDRLLRGWSGWVGVCIVRCFCCLNFSDRNSHQRRVAAVMRLGEFVLGHDTLAPPGTLSPEEWLATFGEVRFCFRRPLASGAGEARVFLVKALR